MPDSHPTADVLSAFSLGMLSPDEASVVEQHVSDCEPCCETIVGLAADDTFVNLVQRAGDPSGSIPNTPRSSDSDSIPSVLAEHPRYDVVRLIGHGGMGDVFEARHRLMNRTVALKVINRELVARAEVVERFRREVEAAAQLAHPNIVTAHDAEQAGDVHFLVMEHVDGTDLSRVVKERGPLPVREACEYARQAALGLNEAHGRGLVHRDIKPHNLMVTPEGTVKILDFGLASLVPISGDGEMLPGRGDLTSASTVMGTPDFISPEQAADARNADARSDVYSLGATLWFLLTGRPLFTEGNVDEKVRSHAEAEPDRLDAVRDDLPAGLADVVARMIAKDPGDRYQTAAEVAAALEPFVGENAGQSSVAAPATEPSRRRGPFSWLAAIGFAALLVAASIYFIVTDNGVVRIEVLDDSLQVRIDGREITLSEDGKTVQTLRAGDHAIVVLQGETELVTDAFDVRRKGEVRFRVTVEQGQVVVSRKGQPSKKAPLPGQLDTPLAAKPDAPLARETGAGVWIWDRGVIGTDLTTSVRSWSLVGREVETVTARLVYVSNGTIEVSGERTADLSGASVEKVGRLKLHKTDHPGDRVALAIELDFGDTASERILSKPLVVDKGLGASAMTRTTKWDGYGLDANEVVLVHWHARLPKTFENLRHGDDLESMVEASKQGASFVVFTLEWSDTTSESESEEPRESRNLNVEASRVLQGHHDQGVRSLAVSPDGELLASASQLKVVVRRTSNGKIVTNIDRARGNVAFGPQGKLLAVTDRSGVSVWDIGNGEKQRAFETFTHPFKTAYGLAISPDGRRLAMGAYDGLKVWSLETGEEQLSLSGHELNQHVTAVAFSPDGKTIASANWGGYYVGKDGTRKAPNEVKVWDAETGKELAILRGGGRGLAFSADGSMIASGSPDGSASVWQVATGNPLHRFLGHTGEVVGVAFSPDGRQLATSGWDNLVKVWNLRSGREAATLRGHGGEVHDVTFGRDGKRLYSASEDKTIRVWELPARHGTSEESRDGTSELGRGATGLPEAAPVVELRWAASEHIPGFTYHENRGDDTGDTYYSLKPVLVLTPDLVASVKHASGTAPPSGDLVLHWAVIELNDEAIARLEREVAEVKGDPVKAEKVEYVTLLVDGDEGVSFPLRPGEMRDHGLRTPSWRTPDAAKRIAESLGDATDGAIPPESVEPSIRLGSAPFRYGGRISSLEYSPDGKRLLSSGGVWGAAVWDAETGNLVRHFPGVSAWTTADFSPDGRSVALAGYNQQTVPIYDVETGEQVGALEQGTKAVRFSPDSRRAFTAFKHTLTAFDTATGRRLESFAEPGSGKVMFATPREGTLVAGNSGDDLRVWDWSTGEEIARAKVRGGVHNRKDLVFTPDGTSLIVYGKKFSRTAEVRDARTLEVTRTLEIKYDPTCLNVSRDGSRLAVGTSQGWVQVFDLTTGKEVAGWEGHTGTDNITAVALSPDGKRLACGTDLSGGARIWDVATRKELFPAGQGHSATVGEIVVLEDGTVLTNDYNRHFGRWDPTTGEPTHFWRWPGPLRHPVEWVLSPKTGCALSGYDKLLLTTDPTDPTKFVDVYEKVKPPADGGRKESQVFGNGTRIESIAMTPDGRIAAAAHIDDRVVVCNLETFEHVRNFTLPEVRHLAWSRHYSLALSPDGKLLAGASKDKVVLWEVETGKERFLPTNRFDVQRLAFSPDGHTLAVVGGQQVMLWSVKDEHVRRTIVDHARGTWAVAFSPDGRTLATGAQNNADTVVLWDIVSGREVRELRGARGGVASLAFAPDGGTIYAGTGSSLIVGWDLARTSGDEQARGDVQPSFDTDRYIPTPFRLHGRVYALEYSPDGKQLLASGSHWGAALFDAEAGELLLQMPKEGMHVTADFSPDAKRVALAEYHHGDLPIWDVKSGKEVAKLPVARRVARFSSDGKLLFTVSAENLLTVYDLETEKTIDLDDDRTFGPDMIATSPKGTLVAAVSRDGRLRVWDWQTKERLAEIAGAAVDVHNCREIVFTPDGKSLVVLGHESATELRDARTLELQRTFDTGFDKFHSYSLAVSRDGQRLAIGCEFGHVVVFDLATGNRVHTRKVRNDYIAAVALSPDGRYLACGSELEGGFHVLDVAGNAEPEKSANAPALRHLFTVATPEGIEFEDADIRISDDQSLVLVGKNGEHLLTIDEKQRTAKAQPVSGWRGMKFVPGERRIVAKTWGEAFVRDPDEPLRAFFPMPHVMVEGDWIDPAVSSDGTILATRPELDHVQFWNMETLRSSGEPLAVGGHVERMQFTSDSNYLCTHTTQGMSLWNPRTGERVAGPFRDGPYIHGLMGEVAYDAVRERVVTIENFGHDAATDMGSRVVVRPLRPDKGEATTIEVPAHATCVLWADPNHLLVSGGRHKQPRELDGYRYGSYPLFVIRLDDDSSEPVELAKQIWYYPVLTPDGRYIIGASNQETLCWKVGREEPVWRTPGRSKVIEATNDCVLLHGFDGRVRALAAGTGEPLREWRDVVRTRFHGDRLWLFGQNTIHVWAFEAGDPAPEQSQPGAGDERSDRSDPSSNG